MVDSSRILVFEPSLSGHRGHYVGVQVRELLRLGANITLAIPENALELPEGRVFLGDVMEHVTHLPLTPIPSGCSSRKVAKIRFEQLCMAHAKVHPRHCYVPYADGIAQIWGSQLRPKRFFGGTVMEGLMMRGRFAYPSRNAKDRATAFLSFRAMMRSPWTRLHHLDPIAYEYLRKKDANTDRHRLIPEIVESNTESDTCPRSARETFSLDPEATVISSPGAVSGNKGCERLVRAVLALPASLNIQLILFGKHSAKMTALLSDVNDPRIHSIDRFASSVEFSNLFRVADIVSACYPRHVGSSSIVLRAAAFGKPVLASDWGWIGWATTNFGLGQTCDATSADSVREAILRLATQEQDQLVDDLVAKRSPLVQYHQKDNHLAHWTEKFREDTGIAPATKRDMPEADAPERALPASERINAKR